MRRSISAGSLYASTNGFDDVAMMLGYGLLDDLVVNSQRAQHAGFIGAHPAAKARYVSEHNRGQLRVSAVALGALSSTINFARSCTDGVARANRQHR